MRFVTILLLLQGINCFPTSKNRRKQESESGTLFKSLPSSSFKLEDGFGPFSIILSYLNPGLERFKASAAFRNIQGHHQLLPEIRQNCGHRSEPLSHNDMFNGTLRLWTAQEQRQKASKCCNEIHKITSKDYIRVKLVGSSVVEQYSKCLIYQPDVQVIWELANTKNEQVKKLVKLNWRFERNAVTIIDFQYTNLKKWIKSLFTDLKKSNVHTINLKKTGITIDNLHYLIDLLQNTDTYNSPIKNINLCGNFLKQNEYIFLIDVIKYSNLEKIQICDYPIKKKNYSEYTIDTVKQVLETLINSRGVLVQVKKFHRDLKSSFIEDFDNEAELEDAVDEDLNVENEEEGIEELIEVHVNDDDPVEISNPFGLLEIV